MFRQSKQLRSHSRLRAHAVFIMVTNFVLSVRSVRRRRLCHAPLADGPPSLEAPLLCRCSSLCSQRPEKTTCPPFGAYASALVSSCLLRCFTSVCGCSRRRCKWSPVGVTWLPRLTADRWSSMDRFRKGAIKSQPVASSGHPNIHAVYRTCALRTGNQAVLEVPDRHLWCLVRVL